MTHCGWVDLQVNGHNGVDFSSPALTEADVARAAEELVEAGTEVFLPTLVTSADELYRRNLPLIRRAVERRHLERHVPGIHMEGPMITSAGAHDPRCIRGCSGENVRRYQEMAEGFIRLMTVSADAPGASEAIAAARECGILSSAGHHLAGYGEIRAAADAGARLLTHLGNACPPLVERHENPLLAGLAEERMTAMIITDGFHLPPELIRIVLKVKGAGRVIVTSDACSLCGCPDGEYELWGNRAVLKGGRLYNPDKGCLVAAVSTMAMCMEYLRGLNVLSEEELTRVGRTNALEFLKQGAKGHEQGTDRKNQ